MHSLQAVHPTQHSMLPSHSTYDLQLEYTFSHACFTFIYTLNIAQKPRSSPMTCVQGTSAHYNQYALFIGEEKEKKNTLNQQSSALQSARKKERTHIYTKIVIIHEPQVQNQHCRAENHS